MSCRSRGSPAAPSSTPKSRSQASAAGSMRTSNGRRSSASSTRRGAWSRTPRTAAMKPSPRTRRRARRRVPFPPSWRSCSSPATAPARRRSRSFPASSRRTTARHLRATVLGVLDGWSVAAAGAAVDRRGLPLGQLARRPHRLAAARAAGRGGGALCAVGDRRPAGPGDSLPPPDIVVTSDLKRYERLKLFILNLGHTYLAEGWRRLNRAPAMTVREAMADPSMRGESGRSLRKGGAAGIRGDRNG